MGMGITGWERIRAEVLSRDGYRCGICGGMGADSVDHIIPRAYGGSHGVGNLRAAHFRCNSKRGAQQRRKQRAPFARASRFG